jgi:adenylate cyclase
MFKNETQPQLLIVDDSVENLLVLQELLQNEYKIILCKTGEKALELLQSTPLPNLILLDVVMPGMSGFEVCLKIKENQLTAKIPVIFLTALNEANEETKGFRVGGADFITKPFNPDIVKARIKTHIELQAVQLKSEALLRVLLPEKVIGDLIKKGRHEPELHANVSVLFCDLVGFTQIAAQISPAKLIEELSQLFSKFDEICTTNGVTRIKTIGDAYMAACGIEQEFQDHAHRIVKSGLEFINFLTMRTETTNLVWRCRIGVHSGSVIGGIVGTSRFVYDIMGDNVNIAARVESNGVPMRVTVTEETKQLLNGIYALESIGMTELKGNTPRELFAVIDTL